jgi:methylthioribulose-1-phosphate dehydratase
MTKMIALPDFARASEEIIEAGRLLDLRNLAPATSGNYSMRLNDGRIAMTVSGKHKGRLQKEDIMLIDAEGNALEDKRPSAETLLHTQIYKLFPQTNAILHAHSVPGVVLNRLQKTDLVLAGYEMLKIFPGIETHEVSVTIPVFENAQDMNILCADVENKINKDIPVYLIRDHGFYAWGKTMAEAGYICEALEHMLACEMEMYKIKNAGGNA